MSNISEAKQKEIREATENTKSIDLSNLGLNDNDMDLLHDLLQNKPHITSVNLSFNAITAEGCRVLLLLPHLRTVNFSHNHLGDSAIEHLVKTKIDKLDISFNGIGDIGAKKIIEHVNKYSELDIDGNPKISRELADNIRSKFAKTVAKNSPPIGIDLGTNYSGSLPDNFFSVSHQPNREDDMSDSLSDDDEADLKAQLTDLFIAFMQKHNCTETALRNALPKIAKEVRPLVPSSSSAAK